MIRLNFLLHLRFDLFEIIGRDAVGEIHVIVKTVFHRRPGGELCLRPDLKNGGGKYMRGRMAETFEIGHRRALF